VPFGTDFRSRLQLNSGLVQRVGLRPGASGNALTTCSTTKGVTVGNTDDAKGRIKEAAGDLTDDDDLKREGKVDRATGAAKDKLDDAADKVKDAVTSDD
jgi:uncharacterized protein YjbJ (UPF0337 family)